MNQIVTKTRRSLISHTVNSRCLKDQFNQITNNTDSLTLPLAMQTGFYVWADLFLPITTSGVNENFYDAHRVEREASVWLIF